MSEIFWPSKSLAPRTYRWSWVTLSGPDAQDYLQRLTTVNLRALPPGRGARGFFLNAQGKVRADFTLWNFGAPGAPEYAFEFDGDPARLLAVIDQTTFAEKLTVTPVEGLGCVWIFSDEGPLSPWNTQAIDEEIRLGHHGRAEFGRPWLTAWGRPARLAQWVERAFPDARVASGDELEAWRISQGRPWAGSELSEHTMPLELGLVSAEDGLAADKGCYPGQEVIERTLSLGSPARRLVLLEGPGLAPAPGSKVLSLAEPPLEAGEVTSATATPTGFQALALVRKLHAKEGLELRGARVVRVSPLAPHA